MSTVRSKVSHLHRLTFLGSWAHEIWPFERPTVSWPPCLTHPHVQLYVAPATVWAPLAYTNLPLLASSPAPTPSTPSSPAKSKRNIVSAPHLGVDVGRYPRVMNANHEPPINQLGFYCETRAPLLHNSAKATRGLAESHHSMVRPAPATLHAGSEMV
jgi:hypothetical protein